MGIDADRTAEDDRIEKRDEAYALALREAEQRQKQAEQQAEPGQQQEQSSKK
jgi:hypothetical protein